MNEQVVEGAVNVKKLAAGGWWLDETKRAQHIAAMKAGWARKRQRIARAKERKAAMEEAQSGPLKAIEAKIAHHQRCLETLKAALELLQRGV